MQQPNDYMIFINLQEAPLDPANPLHYFRAFLQILDSLPNANPRSLAELRLSEEDYHWLLHWVENIRPNHFHEAVEHEIQTNLADYARPQWGLVRKRLWWGLMFFLLECEHARRSDEDFWRSLANIPWPQPLRSWLFLNAGLNPTDAHRVLIIEVVRFFKLRHLFDADQHIHRWERCACLQFAFQNAQLLKQITNWLRKQDNNTLKAVESLLNDETLQSSTFQNTWKTLLDYHRKKITKQEAHKELLKSPWILPTIIEPLLATISQGQHADGALAIDIPDEEEKRSLGIEVRLRWDDGNCPRFEARLPGFQDLPANNNVFRLQWDHIALTSYVLQENGCYQWVQNTVVIPHTNPTGLLRLVTDAGNTVAEEQISLWDENDYISLFASGGKRADDSFTGVTSQTFSIIFDSAFDLLPKALLKPQQLCEGWSIARLNAQTCDAAELCDQQDNKCWAAISVLPQTRILPPQVVIHAIGFYDEQRGIARGRILWKIPVGFAAVAVRVNRTPRVALAPAQNEVSFDYLPGDVARQMKIRLHIQDAQGETLTISATRRVSGLQCVVWESNGGFDYYNTNATLVVPKSSHASLRIIHPALNANFFERSEKDLWLMEGHYCIARVGEKPISIANLPLRGYGASLRIVESLLNPDPGFDFFQVAAGCQNTGNVDDVKVQPGRQTIRVELRNNYELGLDCRILLWTDKHGICLRSIPAAGVHPGYIESPAQLLEDENVLAVGLLSGNTCIGSWFQRQLWWTSLTNEMNGTEASSIAAFCRIFRAPIAVTASVQQYREQYGVLWDWVNAHAVEILSVWMSDTVITLLPGITVNVQGGVGDQSWVESVQEFFSDRTLNMDETNQDALIGRIMADANILGNADPVPIANLVFFLAAYVADRLPSPWLVSQLVRRFASQRGAADFLPHIARTYHFNANNPNLLSHGKMPIHTFLRVPEGFYTHLCDDIINQDLNDCSSWNVRVCLTSPQFRKHLFSRLLTAD